MSTETVKRCDVWSMKRDVVVTGRFGTAICVVRKIKGVTLERLLPCLTKGTTPPGGKGEG